MNHINVESIVKMAGYGPCAVARPTTTNLDLLANPAVPLAERIRLLQDITGGEMDDADVADCLGVDASRVRRARRHVPAHLLRPPYLTTCVAFDFYAPRTGRAAIEAYYQQGYPEPYVTGATLQAELGPRRLHAAGIDGHQAQLWHVTYVDTWSACHTYDQPLHIEDHTYTDPNWVIRHDLTWHVADDDEFLAIERAA
jgi:hypothetical protein